MVWQKKWIPVSFGATFWKSLGRLGSRFHFAILLGPKIVFKNMFKTCFSSILKIIFKKSHKLFSVRGVLLGRDYKVAGNTEPLWFAYAQ